MKKTLTTAILAFATTLGFSQEAPQTSATTPIFQIHEATPEKNVFTYLKVNVADCTGAKRGPVAPGLGLGWRATAGASALDLSLNYSGGGRTDFFTIPKVNYLHYISPASEASLYLGGGLAYGGVDHFVGLIPNAALGYEFNRTQTWRGFTQLDISQPVLAAHGKVRSSPILELSIGGGF